MGADLFHASQSFDRAQLPRLRKASREFIELWDAFHHPHSTGTLNACFEALEEKLEALRDATERGL